MGNTLYLECASGISADMVVGAMLDMGADEKGLKEALDSLDVPGFSISITRKQAGAIDACDFDVVLDDAHDGHDHDMDYLYGHLDEEEHDHGHHHDHHHHHHHHDGHDHLHHHEHRTPADISAIIDSANLSARAKQHAHRIFNIVSAAEAKAHGVPMEEVLFHEVGAVDSIVDVVAAAYCLDNLDVCAGIISPLAEGTGRVRTAHGVLSIPVPAVANIVVAENLTLAQNHRAGEFVTPTGAAIAAAVRTLDALPESYTIKAIGYGSGKRAYNPPSTVRAMLIQSATQAPETSHEASRYANFTPHLWKLETEMDDATGEALGSVIDKLLQAGAREAHYVPVFMKKGRPAYQLEVLCSRDSIPTIEAILFEETTTIGIRRYPVDRTALPREATQAQTAYGPVQGKRVTLPNGSTRTYPEHSSVEKLAKEAQIPYQDALQIAISTFA